MYNSPVQFNKEGEKERREGGSTYVVKSEREIEKQRSGMQQVVNKTTPTHDLQLHLGTPIPGLKAGVVPSTCWSLHCCFFSHPVRQHVPAAHTTNKSLLRTVACRSRIWNHTLNNSGSHSKSQQRSRGGIASSV